jgi:hypothetical protein
MSVHACECVCLSVRTRVVLCHDPMSVITDVAGASIAPEEIATVLIVGEDVHAIRRADGSAERHTCEIAVNTNSSGS